MYSWILPLQFTFFFLPPLFEDFLDFSSDQNWHFPRIISRSCPFLDTSKKTCSCCSPSRHFEFTTGRGRRPSFYFFHLDPFEETCSCCSSSDHIEFTVGGRPPSMSSVWIHFEKSSCCCSPSSHFESTTGRRISSMSSILIHFTRLLVVVLLLVTLNPQLGEILLPCLPFGLILRRLLVVVFLLVILSLRMDEGLLTCLLFGSILRSLFVVDLFLATLSSQLDEDLLLPFLLSPFFLPSFLPFLLSSIWIHFELLLPIPVLPPFERRLSTQRRRPRERDPDEIATFQSDRGHCKRQKTGKHFIHSRRWIPGVGRRSGEPRVARLTLPEMTCVAVFRQLRAPLPVSTSPINAFTNRKRKLSARGAAGNFKIYTWRQTYRDDF